MDEQSAGGDERWWMGWRRFGSTMGIFVDSSDLLENIGM